MFAFGYLAELGAAYDLNSDGVINIFDLAPQRETSAGRAERLSNPIVPKRF